MADIPGIIEGAHLGKGLGLRFLRHIERNSVLLFLLPADSNNLKDEYKILKKELRLHNPDLMQKRRLIAITKCDMLDNELLKELKKEVPKDKNKDGSKVDVLFISSVAQQGIEALKDAVWNAINADV